MIEKDLEECKDAKKKGTPEFLQFLNSKFNLQIEITEDLRKSVLKFI